MSFLKRHHHDDNDPDHIDDETIDPQLRLRSVRTAASAIEESIRSEQRAERRKIQRSKSRFFRTLSQKKRPNTASSTVSSGTSSNPTHVPGVRRNVYVNRTPLSIDLDSDGQPLARYVRNKVRTSKYTILTFIPKNLYEQFRRVANIYFLLLVIVQVFPIFGASSPQLATLPLLFILTVTAIKDGVEDYRRAALDEEVNTSAVTKLGQWANVNHPHDSRSLLQKLFGLNSPGSVTKGVRKLREKEAAEGMRIMLTKTSDEQVGTRDVNDSSLSLSGQPVGPGGRTLDDIQSIDSHSYPPTTSNDPSKASLESTVPAKTSADWGQFGSISTYQQSVKSQSTVGVVDWQKRASGSPRWERTLWKKLEVGDIVLLHNNEQVPADIVLLSTSDPDGMCYLETKNLDGETNLKPRKSIRATSSMKSEEDIERSSFYLDSEPPHQNLYVYHGVLKFADPTTGEEKQSAVTINELLLRGCAIRNTSWVMGLVVFTGADTKIMLNGGATPSKRSKIEKETNFNVIVNFVVLILMCLFSAIFSGLEDSKTGTSADYFEPGTLAPNQAILQALITFVSCLVAFQNIVPISLYISIEIVKTIQAYFISQDIDMYYPAYDTPCVPKTWNISDDLGQIEYVFSDKTGTLTQNIMEFQRCSVNGVVYGEGVTEAQRGSTTRQGGPDAMQPEELNRKLASLKQDMISKMEKAFKNRYAQLDKLTLVSPKLAEDLADRSSPRRGHLIAFFRALAICHSVLADKTDTQRDPFRLEYKAESPDEAALVGAARDVGFPFINKSKDAIDIEVMGQAERYVLLRVIEFDSTRKRMSVIVRAPDGKLVLYCKGADSVIYERLAKNHDPELKQQTHKDMDLFANSGLRTLCIAYRILTENEYLEWSIISDAAASSITNRDQEVARANDIMEQSLTILGATALEDKLQEGVPEAIKTLHQAGIKLWILTGDKLQTAIEIGYSCNLLKNDMEVMIVSADSIGETRAKIEAGLNKIASVLGPPSLDPRKRGFMPGAQASFAVVIDGSTLTHALSDEVKPLFLALGTQCETVVCCRVSPAQKALTVKLVKEGRNAMTLSIGDGANDVAMIQEANIGCGLFGLEGSQAAMSADYAFGQFRYLTKLLLVHGRWSYQRVADMHSNFFYKNVIWTVATFWFLPFNSFDATYLYQYTFILLYNLVFTSLPVIALGAFDQDINAKAALAFPQLYVRGIRGLEYTREKFWTYMLDGLYQSGVVFFFPYLAWSLGLSISWNGKVIDSLSDFGTAVAVAAIFAANGFVGMNTHYWTVITWIVVFGSSIVMLLWIVIYSYFQTPDFVDEVVVLFGELTFWTAVVISVFVALAPRFVIRYISQVYFPLDKDIVREMWVRGDLKDQLGIRHRSSKGDHEEIGLEHAPMFHEPHTRSRSELDDTQNTYEPTLATDTLRDSYPGSPHIAPQEIVATEKPTHLSPNPPSPRYNRTSSPPQLVQEIVATEKPTHLSPNPSSIQDDRYNHTSSPRASYYSVSDIPPPSPLPTPVYRYSNGETTSIPPSRSASIARRMSQASRNRRPTSPSPPPPNPRSSSITMLSTRQGGGETSGRAFDLSIPPSTYGMRVNSPHGFRGSERSTSRASHTSGPDDFWSADEGDDDVTVDAHSQSWQPRPIQLSVRERTHSGIEGQRDDDRSGDDRATIRLDTRRPMAGGPAEERDSPASSTSWHGGVAL